jgi:ATP adenylyltransferase
MRSLSIFNISVNCGASAGQTIMHAHIHLIPRRDGDIPNPRMVYAG